MLLTEKTAASVRTIEPEETSFKRRSNSSVLGVELDEKWDIKMTSGPLGPFA